MPSHRHFPHRPSTWWHATVARFRCSGLSPEAFARSINAHPATLLRWCKQFSADAPTPATLSVGPPRFVEVSVSAAPQPEPSRSNRAVVEAQVGALSLRVLDDADPVFAGTLLAALARVVGPC
ncbi:MAG: hypothetical protein FJ100_10655 [Deltaproteobacteria bacterium]|nr:hypothetical protein [Deltaproteobacteria bacterium]